MVTHTDKRKYPDSITVAVDTREQYPIIFPANIRIPSTQGTYRSHLVRVETVRRTLHMGDYCIDGYEDCCAIERKGSALELFKNLFDYKDMARQGRALTRLVKGVEFPYLMIEASPKDIIRSKLPNNADPELLLSKITAVVAKYGLGLLWLPGRNTQTSRRNMGQVCTHIMVSHLLDKYYNNKPELI